MDIFLEGLSNRHDASYEDSSCPHNLQLQKLRLISGLDN